MIDGGLDVTSLKEALESESSLVVTAMMSATEIMRSMGKSLKNRSDL
jgi:hypothetical protein